MPGLILLCGVMLLIAFLPFIRFAFVRMAMTSRLRRVAKARGMTVALRSPFSMLGGIGGAKNDLYIASGTRTYSVKLLGSPIKKTMLCFYDATHYAVKEYRRATPLSEVFDGKERVKTKTACDFTAFLPAGCERMRPVYLVYPTMLLIARKDGDTVTEVTDGGRLFDGRLYTLDRFLEKLEGDADAK